MEQWKKVAIIGVGLLGGSLGLAIKRRGLAKGVMGFVRRPEVVEKCQAMGIVDRASCNLDEVVTDADLIVLCTPILQMKPLVERMRKSVNKGAIITDVGSAKARIVAELEGMVEETGAWFVGSHPMAGSEKTGFEYSNENLFDGAICVVTPTQKTPIAVIECVEALWRDVGSRVLRLSPEIHDELVSRSSHLPHVVAAQLVAYVLNSDYPEEQGILCSTGFKDTTRIASGSPEMWKDILVVNKEQVVKVLDEFIEEMEKFREILKEGDEEKLHKFFDTAKTLRDKWIAKNRE